MKKVFMFISIVAMTTLFSSCATLFAGGDPSITIDGTTKEPVTIVTEKQTYPNVQLPCVVQVKRHHLDGQRIQVQSENYIYRDIVLEKSMNEWTLANILIGGIIGWGIDLGTNCVSKPSQKHYYIQEEGPKDKE